MILPWKAVSPIGIYNLLPKTNCKKCEEENCMAFAVKLVNMETKLEKCTPLLEEEKYKESYKKLKEILRPLVREIIIGNQKRTVKIGGEYVMNRHELTYINPAPIAIDVDDEMSEEEVIKRVKFINDFTYEYISKILKLDLIAVRSVSNDPKRFKKTVKIVTENTDLPLILCSLNPEVVEAGLSILDGSKPLIYAATKENWKEMAGLALTHKCPLTVFSPSDLKMLISLAKALLDYGIEDLALDPGTFFGDGLRTSVDAFTMLRWKACNEGFELTQFPLVGTPITAWLTNGSSADKAWWEALTASTLLTRYANLLIMHSIEAWSLLPSVIWRFNLYTDPRKPVAVTPQLKLIRNPDAWSPIMVTGNFALTYYLVSGDMESAKIDCYLLVIDTEGIAVECAVPGKRFTPENIADLIKSFECERLVEHRILVIPGKAARLSGDIEDATGWRVLVGPPDSADIAKFTSKWNETIEEIKLGKEE